MFTESLKRIHKGIYRDFSVYTFESERKSHTQRKVLQGQANDYTFTSADLEC